MKDPYQILGVARDATDDEVKSAYRALARKYHPDKYQDSELAEMAGEKMKEINAAYDEIQKIRSGKATGQGAYGNPYGGAYGPFGGAAYGGPTGNASANPYIYARQLINVRRYTEASQVLETIPEAERTAEWNFLMGVVAAGRRHYVDAQHFFDTACGMDPTNAEYADARERLRNRGKDFSGESSAAATPCSICSLCTCFLCTDCCCDITKNLC